jgi:hypothetical protein
MNMTIREALKSNRSHESKEAIISEIHNIITKNQALAVTYKHNIQTNRLTVAARSFIIMKDKYDTRGVYTKTKAR